MIYFVFLLFLIFDPLTTTACPQYYYTVPCQQLYQPAAYQRPSLTTVQQIQQPPQQQLQQQQVQQQPAQQQSAQQQPAQQQPAQQQQTQQQSIQPRRGNTDGLLKSLLKLPADMAGNLLNVEKL
ncbi:cAMP-dependent protein kinase catalytic subunit-like [Bicyclus anynana]|uniref:cAMP-dependent protein kinase catalytic subunit-like n=1 Tax=Bicyclus anynana TaxID=110368 RepID=A0ABM3M3D2_BICAN|nr:cAMP-dependent protein kinase catalytic subunit-like [Bicyclus anynana]